MLAVNAVVPCDWLRWISIPGSTASFWPAGPDAPVLPAGEGARVPQSPRAPERGLVLPPGVGVAEAPARRCVDLRGERVISTDAKGSERKGRAAGAELCRAERRLDGDL